MRKLIYAWTAAVALLFTATSCTNDFLKEEMVATITQDYFDTPAGMDELVYGCYDGIRFLTDNYPGIGFFISISEEANFGTQAQSDWSSNGARASNANGLFGSYNNQIFGAYPCINNCLRAIEGIDSGTLGGQYDDPAYAAFMKGQVLFIKSYMYYMLNVLLGDVYIKESSTKEIASTFYFPRSTASALYEMMIADLEEAYKGVKSYSDYGSVEGRQRVTKGTVAHLLARLYLERAQAAEWGKYRTADGKPDHATYETTAHLGLLFKGSVSTDLDNAIKYASLVIDDPAYALTADFGDIFRDGDYALENSTDVILAVSQGEGMNAARYGHRWSDANSGRYVGALWGLAAQTWAYGQSNGQYGVSEFGFDVYTNKLNDSRFEKTFQVELMASVPEALPSKADADYYGYTSSSNTTVQWQADDAAKFEAEFAATYDYGGRSYQGNPTQGARKIGPRDLGIAYLENTKATAIDKDIAAAMPFVVAPRWMKDGDKYYYHADTRNHVFVNTQQMGMEKGYADGRNGSLTYVKKYLDSRRSDRTGSYGGRDVPMYRVSETYLIRAEAYARKGQWGEALADINAVRTRAAYKAGENRSYTLANLYDTYVYKQLPAIEKAYPYAVEKSTVDAMQVDQDYVTGISAESVVEDYPPMPTWWEAGLDMWNFVNFINNEKLRELQAEFVPFQSQHQAGIQYERMIWHNQMASPAGVRTWDAADNNPGAGQGATAQGHGSYQPHNTFRPFYYQYLDALTDENGVLLSTKGPEALRDYQNPGYLD